MAMQQQVDSKWAVLSFKIQFTNYFGISLWKYTGEKKKNLKFSIWYVFNLQIKKLQTYLPINRNLLDK